MILTDNYDNQILVSDLGAVILKLKDNRPRNIGTIYNNELIGIRKLDHVFRKNDSWGINEAVINKLLKENDNVVIQCPEEKKVYTLTVKEIKEKGKYLFFKQQEFEKQIFVPRKEWRISEIKPVSFKEKIKELQAEIDKI